jgi:membrane-associated phospholipid phosphatase
LTNCQAIAGFHRRFMVSVYKVGATRMVQAATRLIRSTHARLIAGKLVAVAVLAVAVAELSLVANADIAAAGWIHSLTAGWLTTILLGVTELASTDVVLSATAAVVLALAAKRHWRGAIALATSVLLTQAVVAIGKGLMSRPRPDADSAMVEPSGFSFPSAHSASSVALYVMLALIAGSALRKRVWGPVWVAAILMVAAIGISRVYLGAHYPTDVFAGWLIGGILVLGSWALCSRLPAPGRAAAV